jgi:hypothetical protein
VRQLAEEEERVRLEAQEEARREAAAIAAAVVGIVHHDMRKPPGDEHHENEDEYRNWVAEGVRRVRADRVRHKSTYYRLSLYASEAKAQFPNQ